MTNSGNIYKIEEYSRKAWSTKYFFISEGTKKIIIVVQYAFIGLKAERLVYNLGFGTYDQSREDVYDDDVSGNDDHYKVLNTVLSTVPDFLHNYPGVMVMVKGSDSAPEFREKCRLKCKKRCIPPACKNIHRRISIYINYVNKHFGQLSGEYKFWGGKNIDRQLYMEEYWPYNQYDSVFFVKK